MTDHVKKNQPTESMIAPPSELAVDINPPRKRGDEISESIRKTTNFVLGDGSDLAKAAAQYGIDVNQDADGGLFKGMKHYAMAWSSINTMFQMYTAPSMDEAIDIGVKEGTKSYLTALITTAAAPLLTGSAIGGPLTMAGTAAAVATAFGAGYVADKYMDQMDLLAEAETDQLNNHIVTLANAWKIPNYNIKNPKQIRNTMLFKERRGLITHYKDVAKYVADIQVNSKNGLTEKQNIELDEIKKLPQPQGLIPLLIQKNPDIFDALVESKVIPADKTERRLWKGRWILPASEVEELERKQSNDIIRTTEQILELLTGDEGKNMRMNPKKLDKRTMEIWRENFGDDIDYPPVHYIPNYYFGLPEQESAGEYYKKHFQKMLEKEKEKLGIDSKDNSKSNVSPRDSLFSHDDFDKQMDRLNRTIARNCSGPFLG